MKVDSYKESESGNRVVGDGEVQLLVQLEIEESKCETNYESEYDVMSITVFNIHNPP